MSGSVGLVSMPVVQQFVWDNSEAFTLEEGV